MERRKISTTPSKSTQLPHDYLKMVTEVFTANFDAGVKALAQLKAAPTRFMARGRVYADEVLICVSLMSEGQLSATSVYGSADFDPKASSPTVEDLLGFCVDAIGSVYAQLLDSKKQSRLEQLADESLSALEGVPVDWTTIEIEKRKIYVRIDRANPSLDDMADDWLKKHDPELEEREAKEREETEKLFVTGRPKGASENGGESGSGRGGKGSGNLH